MDVSPLLKSRRCRELSESAAALMGNKSEVNPPEGRRPSLSPTGAQRGANGGCQRPLHPPGVARARGFHPEPWFTGLLDCSSGRTGWADWSEPSSSLLHQFYSLLISAAARLLKLHADVCKVAGELPDADEAARASAPPGPVLSSHNSGFMIPGACMHGRSSHTAQQREEAS